jgi:two-component system response regulator YesN
MLQAGTWKVYEIAEETGFGDYKNFAQVFKKYLHTTPKAFMQEITGGLKLE